MKRVAAILVCALSLMVTTQVKADAVVNVKVHGADNKPVTVADPAETDEVNVAL